MEIASLHGKPGAPTSPPIFFELTKEHPVTQRCDRSQALAVMRRHTRDIGQAHAKPRKCNARPPSGVPQGTTAPRTAVKPSSSHQERAQVPTTTCTTNYTSERHSSTCRGRQRRARHKDARREEPDQNQPAYLADELGLSEEDRAGVYKPSTVRTYEQHARIYLKPAELGAIKVGEVQRADVQDFADELLAKELAPGTVSNVLDPIRGFYRRAIDRGLIAVNPARAIDIPQPGSKRPKLIASGAEAAQFARRAARARSGDVGDSVLRWPAARRTASPPRLGR
jgi:hypothetical protein